MEKEELKWEPYRDYIVRTTWMEGLERLLFKYGAGVPIPDWEMEKLKKGIDKINDELKK